MLILIVQKGSRPLIFQPWFGYIDFHGQASNFPAATTAMAAGALFTGRGAPRKSDFFAAKKAVPFFSDGRRALFEIKIYVLIHHHPSTSVCT